MARRESRPHATVPDRIGRYEVLLPIGSGGMGTVYLARRHGVGGFRRDVALKVMHSHLRDAGKFKTALIEEAKIAGRIRHPNVVPVLDVGVDAAGVYLVMDYVEGDSLAGLQRVAKATGAGLPASVGLRVLVDALAGLHAAHELTDEAGQSVALIHRDFSPQNILVGVDGMSRLTDFGVAKARTNLEQTNVGLLKGKLRYMSPEQIRCDPIDRRCDIWAAGVVAWELLAGRRLYASKHEAATMLQMVSEPPPRLRTMRPDIPVALEKAVTSALQLNVDKRCPTAKQLADHIAEAAKEMNSLADRETVADFVSSLVGAVLITRREQVSEVRRLREEITAIRASAVLPRAGASSSDVAVAPAGPEVEPEDVSTVRVPADRIDLEDGTETETTRQLHAPTRKRTASAVAREDITEIQAVADAMRRPARRLGRIVPSLVVVLALLAGFAVVRECTRSRVPEPLAAAGPATATVAATATWGADPAVTASDSTEIAARSGNPTLTVEADLPVAVLRVGEREFSIEEPTRELAVPLTAQEHDRAIRIEATSADGRRTSADLAPGDTTIELRFPRRSVPRAPVATPSKPSKPSAPSKPTQQPSPPPLATNPYLRKDR